MKKILLITLATLLITLTLTSCGSKSSSPKFIITHTLLDSLKDGKIDGYDIPIGATVADVKKKLGEPKSNEYFAGSQYLSYDNVNFFYDTYIFGMTFFEGNKIFGVTVGKSTPSDVKKILGEPTREFQDEEIEGDDFSTNAWKLVYNLGKYKVEFYCGSETSSVQSIYVHDLAE